MNRPDKSPVEEPVVITDKRKIDRDGSNTAAPAGPAVDGEVAAAATEQEPAMDENATLLAERTADLQRLQAEYANYRRRSDRDRLAAGEVGAGRVLSALLPVMDDFERAREHGDLTGAFGAVADKLHQTLASAGLEEFGHEGDQFDPAFHEAVMHDESPDVTVPTCTKVLRKGYRYKERMLRPAMVGVTDPEQTPAHQPETNAPTAPAGDTPPAADSESAPQQDPNDHET